MAEEASFASKSRATSLGFRNFLKHLQKAYPEATDSDLRDPSTLVSFKLQTVPSADQKKWMIELVQATESENDDRSLSWGVIALILSGLIVGFFLAYGIFLSPDFLKSISAPDMARGVIAFLFAFGTISLILIVCIASFWIDIEEVERRVALAKDILVILIGMLGTILGFYFGTLQSSRSPETSMNLSALSMQQSQAGRPFPGSNRDTTVRKQRCLVNATAPRAVWQYSSCGRSV